MSGPITDADVQVKPDDPPWTCIYCGSMWPATAPVKMLQDHVLVCDLHPAKKLRKALQQALAELEFMPGLSRTKTEQRVIDILRGAIS